MISRPLALIATAPPRTKTPPQLMQWCGRPSYPLTHSWQTKGVVVVVCHFPLCSPLPACDAPWARLCALVRPLTRISLAIGRGPLRFLSPRNQLPRPGILAASRGWKPPRSLGSDVLFLIFLWKPGASVPLLARGLRSLGRIPAWPFPCPRDG